MELVVNILLQISIYVIDNLIDAKSNESLTFIPSFILDISNKNPFLPNTFEVEVQGSNENVLDLRGTGANSNASTQSSNIEYNLWN